MGIIFDSQVNEIKTVLFQKKPRYTCSIPVKNPLDRNYYLLGYRSPEIFKRTFGQKVSHFIWYIKKQRCTYNLSIGYFQELINGLKKTKESFSLKNIRGKEFYFQENAIIRIHEMFKSDTEPSIEGIEDDFFQRIVQISQLKYDFTIELINELKEIIETVEDKEVDIDHFFELILDNTPLYKRILSIEYNEDYQYDEYGNLITYQNFEYADEYYETMLSVANKILLHITKEYSINNINDTDIAVYLHQLNYQKDNFIMRKMKGEEYLCHNRAYYYIADPDPDETKVTYQLEELSYDRNIKEIINYSEHHYNIIQYLILGLQKILKKRERTKEENFMSTQLSSEFSKLKFDLSVSDIALLFRLLHEEGLINNKTKTDIYKYISATIKSKNQDNISADSIKNKFLSPDNSSLEKIDVLLVNLRQTLKKIQ